MKATTLRKIEDSTVLILSSAELELLGCKAGDMVTVKAQKGLVTIEPRTTSKKRHSRYSLDKLLAEHKKIQPILDQDREWVTERRPVGKELL